MFVEPTVVEPKDPEDPKDVQKIAPTNDNATSMGLSYLAIAAGSLSLLAF